MSYTDIDKSDDYFNTKLYTGNGSTQSITGVGHQPDFVWIKNRTTDFGSRLLDSVRGATKELFSNSHIVENTNTDSLTSFDSDGFSLGSHGGVNENSSNFVSWSWKESTTAGFDMVGYSGTGSQPATVSHSLGVIPDVVLVKPRNDAQSWCMYHQGIGAGNIIYLDVTSGSGGSSVWNSTSPTSSVFTVNDNQVNKSSTNYIAYCFKGIKGFSKFSSYVGNGSSDGSYIHLGFKPAFYIIKRTDTSGSWIIKDNLRPGYNVNGSYLVADTNQTEATGSGNLATDELSNGFKIRGTSTAINASGGTYIYMAFAKNPFVTSTGIPTTAK